MRIKIFQLTFLLLTILGHHSHVWAQPHFFSSEGNLDQDHQIVCLPVHQNRIEYFMTFAKMIKDFPSFALNRYGAEGAIILDRLRTLSPALEVLSVDPGLAFYIEEFFDFAQKAIQKDPNLLKEPWTLREQFKNFLGFSKWYRVLSLSEAGAEKVLKDGMHCNALRKNEKVLDNCLMQSSLQKQFINRLEGIRKSKKDILLSITQYPEMGVLAASPFKDSTTKFYLFELNLPRLDIFSPEQFKSERKFINFKDESNYGDGEGNGEREGNDGDDKNAEDNFGLSASIESFLAIAISPEEIISSKVYDYPASLEIDDFIQQFSPQILDKYAKKTVFSARQWEERINAFNRLIADVPELRDDLERATDNLVAEMTKKYTSYLSRGIITSLPIKIPDEATALRMKKDIQYFKTILDEYSIILNKNKKLNHLYFKTEMLKRIFMAIP